ncbi:hypothetical protein KP509_01G110500 [Ceratopteris richardii]|nr:hypothetical protein KP509_01G110500 [Ceratopteris richardii]
MLEKLWPSIALAGSESMKGNIEPMLMMYCPSGFKMQISKLFLGDIAPQIEGIKLHPIQSAQLVMDLDFKWGGDPDIILGVHTPVGTIVLIQLENLRLFSHVRVIFKLAEDIPCISGMAISLLCEPKPVLHYTLKPIGGSICSIPGVSEIIKDVVDNLVSDNFQWPNRIILPCSIKPADLSDLELKLQGRLDVTIIRAFSLKNTDTFGRLDPYVLAYVRVLFKKKTKVIQNNPNPEWNETFTFNVEDQERELLVLQVFDADMGSDKLHGIAIYPLRNLSTDKSTELSLQLQPPPNWEAVQEDENLGSILVNVCYHRFTEEEQRAAMDAEQELLKEKKKEAEANILNGTVDTLEGAGRFVVGGIESGAGIMSSGIGKAGKFVTSSFTYLVS